jgi:hypothetical protein
MKTPNTASTNLIKVAIGCVIGLLCGIAIWTFGLALSGDTTPLGDPYYKDTILAPERAFGPWALMLLAIVLTIIAKVAQWWHDRG